MTAHMLLPVHVLLLMPLILSFCTVTLYCHHLEFADQDHYKVMLANVLTHSRAVDEDHDVIMIADILAHSCVMQAAASSNSWHRDALGGDLYATVLAALRFQVPTACSISAYWQAVVVTVH